MDSSALTLFSPDAAADARELAQVRGVGWVLKWAGSVAAICFSVMVLTSFAYQLAAERALARAAELGLREAALPRSTSETIANVVRQNLVADGILASATTMRLEKNGQQLRGVARTNGGDQLTISLSTPASMTMPRWLPIQRWLAGSHIEWRSVASISR
jgi:hypothetical protein